MEIENGADCPKDYLEWSAYATKQQRVCGKRLPPPLVGLGPANLTFVSNEAVGMRGFMVMYQGTPSFVDALPKPKLRGCE